MRIAILAMMAAAVCGGQTTVNGGRDYKGSLKATGTASTVDFSGAGSTTPVKTGTTAARPASCTVGQIYFATDATVGQNLAFCTSSGVWSQMTGGGGGGGGGTGVSYCAPAGGSGTTYACSPSPLVSSYAAGVTLAFVPDVNGAGGATTVNVSGLGAKSVKQADGSTNPGSTDLVAARVYILAYDGTVFRLGLNATNAANITSGTLAAARLPLPGASAVGGVQSKAASSRQFLTAINTDGSVSAAQPAGTDLSDTTCAVTVGATPSMNATNCNGTGGSYNTFKLGPLAQNTSPTFSNGLAGRTYVIQVYQGTGTAFTMTWPANVTGGCPVSPTLSSRTQLAGIMDNTGSNLLVQSCTYLDDASTIIQGPTRTAPATPAAGSVSCWFDSTANTELCKDSSGNVSAAVRTSSGATSNQWVTHIDTAGVQQKSQPNFTNLAGALALPQTPLTTRGDLLVVNSTPGVARLGVGAADTVLMGGTDPAYVSLTNCGDSTHAVSYNTTTHSWGCQAIAVGGGGGAMGFTPSAQSVTAGVTTAAVVPFNGTLSDKAQAMPSCTSSAGVGFLPGGWTNTTTQMTITFSPSAPVTGTCTAVLGAAVGPGYTATSSTSLLIAAASKTFTTQAGLAYTVGARARASSAANTANYMEGLVTAYSGTTLTLNVTNTGGSGTLADWNINLAGDVGATGPTGPGVFGTTVRSTTSVPMVSGHCATKRVFDGTALAYTMLATPPDATCWVGVANESHTSVLTIAANGGTINGVPSTDITIDPCPSPYTACYTVTMSADSGGTSWHATYPAARGATGPTGPTGPTGAGFGTNPSMGNAGTANGISITATAGSGGVTAKLLAGKDASNPTTYVLPASGGCGSGIAAASVSAAATFELYVVPGLVLTGVADNAVTAGHILVGGTSTVGRVRDSGQTSRTAISNQTCIVGVAQASASTAGDVLFRYDGPGTYGQLTDLTAVSGTLPAANLPNPSASALGGIQSKTCTSGDFVSNISTSGVVTCATPSGGGSPSTSTEFFPFGVCSYCPSGTAIAGSGAASSGLSMAFQVHGAGITSDKLVFYINAASGTSCTGGTCGAGFNIYGTSSLVTPVCVSVIGTSGNGTADLNINTTGVHAVTWASGSGVSGGVCTLSAGLYVLIGSTDSTVLTVRAATDASVSGGMMNKFAAVRWGQATTVSTGNGAGLAITADLSAKSWTAVSNFAAPMFKFQR